MVILDVMGAFDAAWWPSILSNLRDLRCPKNLYALSQNYFSERVATLHTNTQAVRRIVTNGCPQVYAVAQVSGTSCTTLS